MNAVPFDIDGSQAAWTGMMGKTPVQSGLGARSLDIDGQQAAWAGTMSKRGTQCAGPVCSSSGKPGASGSQS
jgi:uncharacterized Zn-binding protein involved in type VI secretion